MKSTQVTDELKKNLGLSRNDEIVPALEAALASKVVPPIGITLVITGKQITSAPINLPNPTAVDIESLQNAMRIVIDAMEKQRAVLLRQEIRAELTASDDLDGDDKA